MTDTDVIIARLDGMEENFKKDIDHLGETIGRLDRKTSDIFRRLDETAKLGHEVRVKSLETRMDGFWGKITGLIALVTSVIASIGAFVVWLMTQVKGE